jgi:hypothetical protein
MLREATQLCAVPHIIPSVQYRVITSYVSDYVKFIGKNVIATRKLNAHHCKEQLIFFIPYASSVCAPFVALYTSRRYSTSCQTLCDEGCSVCAVAVRIRAFKLLRSWALAERKPHLSQSPTGKRQGGWDLEIAEARMCPSPRGQSTAQATAY